MLQKAKKIIKHISNTQDLANSIYNDQARHYKDENNDLKNDKILIAKLLIALNKQKEASQHFSEVEFQVFSQFGDDGIIQHIINHVDFPAKNFIEFGVETYKESNTRFLLINNNWSGMVIDGSETNINFIKNDVISFFHEIHAKHAFISKENINELLSEYPFGDEIGILSIDIDGNDYYVWNEITVINPILVIVEYNSVFGPANPWTIPYDANYQRNLHTSDVLVYGTSLLSLCDLAEEKGYYFIGCNSAGNNAYFLRKDKIGSFKPLTSSEGYITSKFSEYYDHEVKGRVRAKDRINTILNKTVYNTRKKKTELINPF